MKPTWKALGLVLALGAAWTTGCKSSQAKSAEPATPQEQIFHEADLDSDGRIDSKEFTRYFYTISFDVHDVDSNDQLTLVEWVGPDPEQEYVSLFAEMDADGSTWLVIEEYSSHGVRTLTVTNAFRTLDRNNDAYVELAELVD